MERRDLLRGMLLSAPAVMLGPGVADLVGAEEAPVAVLSPRDEDTVLTSHILAKLTSRINGYTALAGQPPRLLPVNRYEFREAVLEIAPHRRFIDSSTARAGFNNVLWNGVPIVNFDPDVLEFKE